MPPEKHAKLSASSAHRWMNCNPSANLEREFADRTSEAAAEGSAAHALCEHKDAPRDLLTEEMVELLTIPADLATYKNAIMDALLKGTKRNVESEPDAKNAVVE